MPFNGTVQGTPQWVAGIPGWYPQMAKFDGTWGISLPVMTFQIGAGNTNTNPWAIKVIAQPNLNSALGGCAFGGGLAGNIDFPQIQTLTNLRAYYGAALDATVPLSCDGKLSEYLFDYDGTTLRFFLNGLVANSIVFTPGTFTQTALGIGANGQVLSVNPWLGNVVEVALYNGSRHTSAYTPQTAPTPTNDTNLYALYTLNGTPNDSKAAAQALGAVSAKETAVAPTTATVTCSAGWGGTAPYTAQWYRSTSVGVQGSAVGGATSLTLNDTGLTSLTTYYYTCIVTDNVAATSTSNQVAVTTLGTGPWVLDRFTGVAGTSLFAHTPDIPAFGNWDILPGYFNRGVMPVLDGSGHPVVPAGPSLAIQTAPNTPAPGAEYDVSADISMISTVAGVGVAGRVQAAGYSYVAEWVAGSWFLVKTGPTLGSTVIGQAGDTTHIQANAFARIMLRLRNPGPANQTALTLLVSQDNGITWTTKLGPINDTDANLTPAGLVGIFSNQSNGTNSLWGRFKAVDKLGTDLAANMATPYTSLSNQTITLAGTNTTWTAGTPGTPAFTVTGTNGATLVSQVVNSATSATLTVNTGASAGTLIVTDPSTGNTFLIQIIAAPVTILVTDSNWLHSLGNWQSSGSAYVQSQMQGAYGVAVVQGTKSIRLLLDMISETTANVTANRYPILGVSVNNSLLASPLLTYPTTSLLLASNLNPGTVYVVEYWIISSDFADGAFSRWVTPANYVKILGLQLDAGGSSSSIAAYLRGQNWLFYGDSTSEGYGTELGNQGQYAVGITVGFALGAEVGIIGFGGSGWTNGGGATDSVPFYTLGNDALSSWNKHANGISRLVGGKFSPMPDGIINAHGITGVPTQAQVQGWLTACRAALNPTTPIVMVNPYGGPSSVNATACAIIYAAAVAAQGDPYVYYVKLTDRAMNGMGGGIVGASQETQDGVHMITQWYTRVGAGVATAIARKLAQGGGQHSYALPRGR